MTTVDLVCGFLGAGKTTFLTHYMQYFKQRQIHFALIENEFGTAGVDTVLLQEQTTTIKELSGGCICCSLKIGFHDTLLSLSNEFPHILVEPSGVFDVDDFFDVLQSVALSNSCNIGTIILILDATTICNLSKLETRLLHSSLLAAGSVFLSKWDLLDTEIQKQEVLDMVSKLAPHALCFYKPLAEFTVSDFADISSTGYFKVAHDRDRGGHTNLFQSTCLTPKKKYTAEQLFEITSLLKQDSYGTVLRVKGFVPFSEHFSLSFNFTPTATEIVELPKQSSMLNIIGTNLNRKLLKALLP